MILGLLKASNRYLPEGLRLALLPYYRRFLPGVNNIIFVPQIACNYSCPYCIWNRFTPAEYRRAQHGYAEWISVFERFAPSAFTITGGEPLLYRDLEPLIAQFPRKHLISCLVSNLEALDIASFSALKRREFRIMASFHPSMTTKERFLSRLDDLRAHGFRNVTVNFVAYPQHLEEIPALKKYFEGKSGFYFRVDTFKDPGYDYTPAERTLVAEYKGKGIIPYDRTERYDFNDRSAKRCKAGRTYALIIPNGNVYTCMEGYYYTECAPYKGKSSPSDTFFAGNVFDGSFSFSPTDKICHSPCAELCDIEMAGVRRV